jgi:hypothetical protein
MYTIASRDYSGGKAMISDTQYDQAIARAAKYGAQGGTGINLIDILGHNYTLADLERMADGITDGAPDTMDSLPYLDLSGQWADGMRSEDVLEIVLPMDVEVEDMEDEPEATDDIVEAYRVAYDEAMVETVERMLTEQIAVYREQ